jgi:hypothetical protein
MLLGGSIRFLDRLRDLPVQRRRGLGLTITGSLVAYQVAPVLEPVSAMAYTTAPTDSAAALGLVEADEEPTSCCWFQATPPSWNARGGSEGWRGSHPRSLRRTFCRREGDGVDDPAALLEWANRQRWLRERARKARS